MGIGTDSYFRPGQGWAADADGRIHTIAAVDDGCGDTAYAQLALSVIQRIPARTDQFDLSN